ncbi:MAG: type II secretion system protein, partial [Burkholderiaceae bacterium]
MLIVLALTALAAVQTGQRLADARQRENEEELLFVGEQYRQAIQSYWRQSPGALRAWPARLEDLLEDTRFPQARRHLRKLYADPISPETGWGLVTQGNAVIGVYSQAEGLPFRQAGFSEGQLGFADAQRYAEWRFVAAAPAVGASGPPSGSPKPNPSNPGGPKPPPPPP